MKIPYYYIYNLVLALILFSICGSVFAIYASLRYFVQFLPQSDTKVENSSDVEKQTAVEESEEPKETRVPQGVFKRLFGKRSLTPTIPPVRGGEILETSSLEWEEILRPIDPVFLLIHIEKIRMTILEGNKKEMELKSKPKIKRLFQRLPKSIGKKMKSSKLKMKEFSQGLPKPIKKEFLGYIGIGILAISQLKVNTPVSSVQTQTMKRISSFDEIYRIPEFEKTQGSSRERQVQVGDKVLTFRTSSEAVVEEKSKPKSAQTRPDKLPRRSQVRKFSDLPPLPDSQFDEILKEYDSSSFKIRIRN